MNHQKGDLASPEDAELEKLATKLFDVFNGTKTESVYDNRSRWIAMAKYVTNLTHKNKGE